MANGNQCYHCKSYTTRIDRENDNKTYCTCGACGKTFIVYPQVTVSAATQRKKSIEEINREKETAKK